MSSVMSKNFARAAFLATLGSIGCASALRLRAAASAFQSQTQFAKGDIIAVPSKLMLEYTANTLGVSVDDPVMAKMKQSVTDSIEYKPKSSLKVAVTGVSGQDVNVKFFTSEIDSFFEEDVKNYLKKIAVPAGAKGVSPVMIRSEKYPSPCEWDCKQSIMNDTKLRVGMHVTVDNYDFRNIAGREQPITFVDRDGGEEEVSPEQISMLVEDEEFVKTMQERMEKNGRVVKVVELEDWRVVTKFDFSGAYGYMFRSRELEAPQVYEIDNLVAFQMEEFENADGEETEEVFFLEDNWDNDTEESSEEVMTMSYGEEFRRKNFVMEKDYPHEAEFRAGMILEKATEKSYSRTVYNSEGYEGRDSSSWITYEYKTLKGGESVEELKKEGWEKMMIKAFDGSDEERQLVDGMQVQYLTNDYPVKNLVAGWLTVEKDILYPTKDVIKIREHTIDADGEFDSNLYHNIEPHRLRWIEVAENTLPFAATPEENAIRRVRVTPTKSSRFGNWSPAGEAFEGTIAPCPENVSFRANPSSVATEIVMPDGTRQWFRNADITLLG